MVAVRLLGKNGRGFECKVMGLEFGFCCTFRTASDFVRKGMRWLSIMAAGLGDTLKLGILAG